MLLMLVVPLASPQANSCSASNRLRAGPLLSGDQKYDPRSPETHTQCQTLPVLTLFKSHLPNSRALFHNPSFLSRSCKLWNTQSSCCFQTRTTCLKITNYTVLKNYTSWTFPPSLPNPSSFPLDRA